MSFALLDADQPDQLAAWLALWQAWPGREVLAHPDYARLFAGADERVVAATWQGTACSVLFPLILRPLDALAFYRAGRALWDATSPYGYGGPFAWGDLEQARVEFWPAFEAWASQVGLVSCFARLSLFDDDLALPLDGVADTQLNVVRSLDLDDASMWMDYAHKVRKNVQRAERDGVTIELDPTGLRLDEFCAIYTATMQRREAAAGYFFNKDFFARIVKNLPGQFAFFHALLDDKLVSTELVLVSASHVYSFLGGTLDHAFAHRPNDLLKHRAIQWARDQGKQAFVLGGGYGGDDGIFAYKKSFAPNGVRPFRVLRLVLDASKYQELIEQRQSWAEQQGQSWEPKAGYFPTYRA